VTSVKDKNHYFMERSEYSAGSQALIFIRTLQSKTTKSECLAQR
jgi:hypothetical protein